MGRAAERVSFAEVAEVMKYTAEEVVLEAPESDIAAQVWESEREEYGVDDELFVGEVEDLREELRESDEGEDAVGDDAVLEFAEVEEEVEEGVDGLSEEALDYWVRVAELAVQILESLAEGAELSGSDEVLVGMGRKMVQCLRLVLASSYSMRDVVVAAARVVADEEVYVRRGESPPTEEADGADEVQAYYVSLVEEAKRILIEAPGPPKGWKFDA